MSARAQAFCPRCPQAPLRPVGTREGTLGFCAECRGHWLTPEASPQLTPFLTQSVAHFPDAGRSGHCAHGLHALAEGQEVCGVCPTPSLRCAGCAARLLPLALGAQTVHVCVRCPGMWLDAHGLTALKAGLPPPALKGPLPLVARVSEPKHWGGWVVQAVSGGLSALVFRFLLSLLR